MPAAPLLLPLLLVPLCAAALLGLVGDRKFAPEINILGSAATFAASLGLDSRSTRAAPSWPAARFSSSTPSTSTSRC